MSDPTSSHARRNRMIAIVAGAITVIAIVLAFASEYLELPWKWMRPAAELLLLGELVGLVVLERHQLFEPVSEKVSTMESGIAELRTLLGRMDQKLDAAGQLMVAVGAREALQLRVRLLQRALTRMHDSPQLLRIASLSGLMATQDPREVGGDLPVFQKATSEVLLKADSAAHATGHRWSSRNIVAWSILASFKAGVEILRFLYEDTLNVEIKALVRAKTEAMLSPRQITDEDVLLGYDDETAPTRWAIAISGRQYVSLFARWFDDRWNAIPDTYLIYSRNGFNQVALERIQKEIEANEAARNQSAS